VAGHWQAGRLRTAVHATYTLKEIALVHEILERRQNLGRVVVTV
jgi:NADPH:quinone reductase-like Zn-dependent oxidoreductase